jgi:hypothetical protein
LQQGVGSNALTSGTAGQQQLAAYQQALGQGLTGQGAAGVGGTSGALSGIGGALTGQGAQGSNQLAQYQQGLAQGLTGGGAAGLGSNAAYQSGTGQQLQNQGASTLSTLFSPQYEQQQVQAALQAGTQSALDAQNGQNAMYGGAGGLGSSREALADANLQSLTAQRQQQAAASAESQVQQNQMAAANSLLGAGTSNLSNANSAYGNILGAGQTAAGNAGSLYSNLLGQGTSALGTSGNLSSNLLSAGQGANTAAQSGYAGLASQGTSNLGAANTAAAANIGYAQTPQNTYNQYASTIFGVPTASTTPNYAGTQSNTSSGKGKSLGSSDRKLKKEIEALEYGLNEVMQLRSVRWKWKDKAYSLLPEIGFIAQEVEEIMPEVVDETDGVKGIHYSQLVSVLSKAIQDQQNLIEHLADRVRALEK